MQTLINTKLPEFKSEAYLNEEFKTITHNDLQGKWSISSLPCRFHIRLPNRAR